MLKYLILFILKRLIKILNFNKRFVAKLAPINFIYTKFITLFLFIRSLSKLLKSYTIFKYLGKVLRLLSFSGLLINSILFILLMELEITGWTKGVISYVDNLNWLPTSIKDWFINLWNWFSFYISIIWSWFTQYLTYILERILRIIKPEPKEPVHSPDLIDPSKSKYGDVYNKEYLKHLAETLDEYKVYIYIAIGVVAVTIISIKIWQAYKGSGDGGGGGNEEVSIESLVTSEPSTGRNVGDYPEGYLQYFSKKNGEYGRTG